MLMLVAIKCIFYTNALVLKNLLRQSTVNTTICRLFLEDTIYIIRFQNITVIMTSFRWHRAHVIMRSFATTQSYFVIYLLSFSSVFF